MLNKEVIIENTVVKKSVMCNYRMLNSRAYMMAGDALCVDFTSEVYL